MFMTLLVIAVALAPSVLLMAWALWHGAAQPPENDTADVYDALVRRHRAPDFLDHRDTWGAL